MSSKYLQIRLNEDYYDIIKELVKYYKVNRSDLIRILLVEKYNALNSKGLLD